MYQVNSSSQSLAYTAYGSNDASVEQMRVGAHVGHAEVHHRLGVTDRSAWWDLLGKRLVGLHLHDVRGLTDHRAPGKGDVDFRWLAARIAAANPLAARTFEIDQHESDEEVTTGLQLLIDTGCVPG